jgi:hypothetical protein
MITFKQQPVMIAVRDVVYANDNAVHAIANAMVMQMAEANVDMVIDMPEEYNTKQEIEVAFCSLNEQAVDMVKDYMADLTERVIAQLRSTKTVAKVRCMSYNANDELDDFNVELTVE